ncbi:ribosome small subunit-dependent GTPase A [Eubacterium sp. AB3007]|jgi:ribosome biogenesis GTPase|uniref:ribosome small subunit-dependent GTPase A n=1 Tax=Eubacterium sp. AB3007 TaxID=1392487 RepID=UPI00048A22A8|nr:ribosome small subunit-dependent GTPase A [Eubacterium sp. AB3007]
MRGLITKGIGGFYYVRTEQGVVQTRGRGIFRNEDITPTVGDEVEISLLEGGDGVVEEILPRRNLFARPPIANVDRIVIVFAATRPKPSFDLIDRFLIMAESKGVDPILCMNKVDLLATSRCEQMIERYRGIYPCVMTSGIDGRGLEDLKALIGDQTVAFAGPSGAGKSTLINLLVPEASMETSEISRKTRRGRHTTRHVEILQMPDGGLVFDTPGFTSFDIRDVDEQDLWRYYPEIAAISGNCRFDDCMHIKEPDCAVRKAVEDGQIRQERYDSYVKNYQEIKENNRRNYG